MKIIFVSRCSEINISICSSGPLLIESASRAKCRCSVGSSVISHSRFWIRILLSSRQRYSAVSCVVATFSTGSPLATLRQMSGVSHDFPIFGAPARMNNPYMIRVSTTNSIGFSGSAMGSPRFTVFSFVNRLSSFDSFLVDKNILAYLNRFVNVKWKFSFFEKFHQAVEKAYLPRNVGALNFKKSHVCERKRARFPLGMRSEA